MRTILTKKQQQEWLTTNHNYATLEHRWSTRGYGSSRFLDTRDQVIGSARGCGYDRRGAALGVAITAMLGPELYLLAKRECKGRNRSCKQSKKFYGLFFFPEEDRASVDGGCGFNCMTRILNKIGFTLRFVGASGGSNSGVEFYIVLPITDHDRRFLK